MAFNWMDLAAKTGQGAAGGSTLGPWGAVAGGALGAAGAGIDAAEAERLRKEEEKKIAENTLYNRGQDAKANFNTERQLASNSLAGMKDDYKTALYRALGRG